MDKILTVELIGKGDAYAEARLPLTPYELLDTLDRLRMAPEDEPRWGVCEYLDHSELRDRFGSGSFYALNALCTKLAEMTAWEHTAFEGLVEAQKHRSAEAIPLDTLIDFAYGARQCHVVPARTDAELGRFYVDNGFVPEADALPDEVVKLLDFAKIGRESRLGEGGAFAGDGYVVPAEVAEVHKELDFTPRKPDYAVLVELTAADPNRRATLPLPAPPAELDAALDRAGAAGWNEVSYRCLDCRVPALCGAITDAGNIAHANRAAEALDRLPEDKLLTYKAVLEATGIAALDRALDVARHIDEYSLAPEQDSYEAVARRELRASLGEREAQALLPNIDLYRYGQALQEREQFALTGYGRVQRVDCQPLLAQALREQQLARGAMTMQQTM